MKIAALNVDLSVKRVVPVAMNIGHVTSKYDDDPLLFV